MASRRATRAAGKKRAAGDVPAESSTGRWQSPALRTALAAIVLMAITANTYAPAFRCGYIWDDDSYVTRNPTLETADGLRRIWFELGATPQYYPLVFSSFWIEYQLFGHNPAVSHAVNVLLHCAGAVLVWRVLRRLGLPEPAAWLAGLIFGVHPVHVESVAWITERKNVLSGVCYLAALLAYLRFDQRPEATAESVDGGHRWRWYGLALLLFVAALLSKTVTATLPIVILLVSWYRYRRVTPADVIRVLPMVLLGVAFGAITVWVERHQVGAVGQDFDLSPIERVLLAGRAAWFYAGKLLCPWPLVFIYPRWQIDQSVAWQYLYPAGALALVVVLWALRGRIGIGPLVAVLCFGVTLGPALGFVNVYPFLYSYVADHFQYLASIALIALIAALAWYGYQRMKGEARIGLAVLFLAWVGMLAVLSWRQIADYADVETLWTHTLAKNPNAWIASHNLSVLYMELDRLPEAEHFVRWTVRIHPKYARALNNLGLLQLYKRDVPGAIANFQAAAQADPGFPGSHYNLARINLLQGDVASAARHYLAGLRTESGVAASQEQMGLEIARAAGPEAGRQFLEDALVIRPDWPPAMDELARIARQRIESPRAPRDN